MRKSLNDGLVAFQDGLREETIIKIDKAIVYLRSNGLNITKTSLANEAGVNRKVLYKPHVKRYLRTLPEFNPNIEFPASVATMSELNEELKSTKEQLLKTKKANKNLRVENEGLRLRINEIDEKYKRLLGRYQSELANKVISIQ